MMKANDLMDSMGLMLALNKAHHDSYIIYIVLFLPMGFIPSVLGLS